MGLCLTFLAVIIIDVTLVKVLQWLIFTSQEIVFGEVDGCLV